jgi:serine/tyrosine/threonine adenylyltransferase
MLPGYTMNQIADTERICEPIASFSNSYARLPERFFVRLDPTPVDSPRLVQFNTSLAAELGLDIAGLDADTLAGIFAGNLIPRGAEPLAMAYAGHQFGGFVPALGDGRAILLGEIIDRQGVRRDLQLKGSGRTPYSRLGDGRATLGPMLREYLISESMHALRIPSTRSLAVVNTGERVRRERSLPGAILTRVAAGHVRVGSFEYFAARADVDALQRLADYVIDRHYPECRAAPEPLWALLQAVADRQAQLIARWLRVGFIHGVMNTDNMAISGETIDYGPCAFMDAYDPATVFSSIDQFGRYAYANQPRIAQWNLASFVQTLLPLLDPEPARALERAKAWLGALPALFAQYWLAGMRGKLGLSNAEDGDLQLAEALLDAMYRNNADFTLTFRRLCDAAADAQADTGARALFSNPQAYDEWAARWRARLSREARQPHERARDMRGHNPAFIPRNHRVEQALEAAVERDDLAPFSELLQVLSRPYEEQPAFAAYAEPPEPGQRVMQTFCGT